MNRPNPNEYDEVLSLEDYVDELEKYCDYLEEEFRLKKLELGFAKLHREWDWEMYDRNMERIDKALDKACELIAHHYWGKGAKKWVAEQWKEDLLKDEG